MFTLTLYMLFSMRHCSDRKKLVLEFFHTIFLPDVCSSLVEQFPQHHLIHWYTSNSYFWPLHQMVWNSHILMKYPCMSSCHLLCSMKVPWIHVLMKHKICIQQAHICSLFWIGYKKCVYVLYKTTVSIYRTTQ